MLIFQLQHTSNLESSNMAVLPFVSITVHCYSKGKGLCQRPVDDAVIRLQLESEVTWDVHVEGDYSTVTLAAHFIEYLANL